MHITVRNGATVPVLVKGTVFLPTQVNGEIRTLILKNVCYVPEIVVNLMSISPLNKGKYKTYF